MTTKSSKASLARQLKDRNITVPRDASIKQLQHRLTHWEEGYGYLFRLAIKRGRQHSIAKHLPIDKICWIPNSAFARAIFNSRYAYFLGRSPEAPNGVLTLDVPEDYGEEE